MEKYNFEEMAWVEWDSMLNGHKTKHVGYIIKKIMPYINVTQEMIEKINPSFQLKMGYENKTRNIVSYLIKLPYNNIIYWPPTDQLRILNDCNWHFIYDNINKDAIDCSDRKKLLKIFSLLKQLFDIDYLETYYYIEQYGINKRFWFAVDNDIEFVAKIENLKAKENK